jgi:hypothetical protein
MPITYRIDHEGRVVIARGYGTLTDEEVFRYQREAWSGMDVVGYNELVDLTHVSKIELPSVERVQALASVAASMDRAPATSRFAIVAPGDLAYGLGRMFQTYRRLEKSSTKEVEVFRTLSDALAFLRISQPVPLPPLPPDPSPEE